MSGSRLVFVHPSRSWPRANLLELNKRGRVSVNIRIPARAVRFLLVYERVQVYDIIKVALTTVSLPLAPISSRNIFV